MKKYSSVHDDRDRLSQWFSNCWVEHEGEVHSVVRISNDRVWMDNEPMEPEEEDEEPEGQDVAIKDVRLVPDDFGFVVDATSYFGVKYVYPRPRRQYLRGLSVEHYTRQEAEHLFLGPKDFEVPRGVVKDRHLFIVDGGKLVYYRGLLIGDRWAREVVMK